MGVVYTLTVNGFAIVFFLSMRVFCPGTGTINERHINSVFYVDLEHTYTLDGHTTLFPLGQRIQVPLADSVFAC